MAYLHTKIFIKLLLQNPLSENTFHSLERKQMGKYLVSFLSSNSNLLKFSASQAPDQIEPYLGAPRAATRDSSGRAHLCAPIIQTVIPSGLKTKPLKERITCWVCSHYY